MQVVINSNVREKLIKKKDHTYLDDVIRWTTKGSCATISAYV